MLPVCLFVSFVFVDVVVFVFVVVVPVCFCLLGAASVADILLHASIQVGDSSAGTESTRAERREEERASQREREEMAAASEEGV